MRKQQRNYLFKCRRLYITKIIFSGGKGLISLVILRKHALLSRDNKIKEPIIMRKLIVDDAI